MFNFRQYNDVDNSNLKYFKFFPSYTVMQREIIPTMYVVPGKAMFSQVFVCLQGKEVVRYILSYPGPAWGEGRMYPDQVTLPPTLHPSKIWSKGSGRGLAWHGKDGEL